MKSQIPNFRAKERICLRELKEARLRVRILRATGYLETAGDQLIDEANQLVAIVSTICSLSLDSRLWAFGL